VWASNDGLCAGHTESDITGRSCGESELSADDSRYGRQRQADQGGFIVAFPNGASRLPGGRLATWNAGACCAYARDGKSDDVGFARAVVGAIGARR
jgi:polyhydroxybutyrate depolymerase